MLFFANNDELEDETLDEEEADAASDEDSEEEEADEEDDLSDLDEEDESDEDDSEDDEEDDDDKPVTQKQLREALKGNRNNRNARRRVSSKKRIKNQSPELEKDIADLKESNRLREIAEKKADFAEAHNLSRRQANYVFKQTKRPTAKFLEKPHVAAALQAIKSQEGVARNTPSGSGKRGNTYGGKKFTELSSEEKQANFADRRRSILANKR